MDRRTSFAMTNRALFMESFLYPARYRARTLNKVSRHCEGNAAVHGCAFSTLDGPAAVCMTVF
jgi:hypothetical protein